jgi:AAA+ ATPase superfamily predicted ATPase
MAFTLRPATGGDFIDRKELIAEMIRTLSDRRTAIGFALYGRRRIGKTSIFKEVQRRLQQREGLVPVYFSLWDLVEGTLIEFSQQLSTAVLEAYRPRLQLRLKAKSLLQTSREILRDILRDLKISVKLREDIEFLFSLERNRRESEARLLEKTFSLPEGLAEQTKTRCVLFLDEFPTLIELKNGSGEGLIRKIRTIQEDLKHTVLCISGSIRRTMEITVLTSASAFYGQFILKEVGPLEKKDVKALIERNLPARLTAEALEELYEFTCGIPFYVQFLGRQLLALDLERVERSDIAAAATHFLEEEGDLLFREEFERLSPKERMFAVAMASHLLDSPSAVARKTEESLNTVGRYLGYLEEKGVIRREARGIYRFEDPVFACWLARKYG